MNARSQAAPDRSDVEAFLAMTRHAVMIGALDRMSRAWAEAALAAMVAELRQPQPRWHVLRDQAAQVRAVLGQVTHPAIVLGLQTLPWP